MTNQNHLTPNFWDERYSQAEYAFGTEPNDFFQEQIDLIKPGKLLLPAEGEGRNAVYAAVHGWDVTAFDSSIEARNKAIKLSESRKVKINYSVSDIESMLFKEQSFDVIALIYIHFPSEKRSEYHKKLSDALKSGGTIIIECFSKEQLNYTSGGPKEESMLLSVDSLKLDFFDFNIIKLEQVIISLNEGRYHQGKASVIRMVAKKR